MAMKGRDCPCSKLSSAQTDIFFFISSTILCEFWLAQLFLSIQTDIRLPIYRTRYVDPVERVHEKRGVHKTGVLLSVSLAAPF
jgi:hypothetical protein